MRRRTNRTRLRVFARELCICRVRVALFSPIDPGLYLRAQLDELAAKRLPLVLANIKADDTFGAHLCARNLASSYFAVYS
jgi:hypothetical protein